MFKQGLFASSLMMASISTAIAVPYGFFDARSIAMGNTSVATGSMSSAAFSNPALLVNNVSDDSFILSVGLGGVLVASGGVKDDIDAIDSFQTFETDVTNAINEFDPLVQLARDLNSNNPATIASALATIDSQYNPNGTLTPEQTLNAFTADQIVKADAIIDLSNNQIEIVNGLDGDSILGKASPGVMLGYSGDTFSLAASYQYNAIIGGGLFDINIPLLPDAQTLVDDTVAGATVNDVIGDPTGKLRALQILSSETGLSIASKLTVAGMNVAVGVKPKIVSVKATVFNADLETFDDNTVFDDTETDLGSFTSLDAGITVDISDSIRLGLVGTNLVSKTLTLDDGTGIGSLDIDFNRQLRVGAAYNNSFFTLAVDMDLIESEPVLLEDPTKMLAVGMELNAFDFLQLRFGYQDNMASGSTTDPLLSAGVGLWLLGVNLELAAVGNSSDSLGVFVQTGVRF